MVKDLLCFSDCGQYFVYSGPDGKLKVWDSLKGTLKQEYVPNFHLNSPCTSIVWINTASSSVSPTKSKKRKVDEKSSLILAFGTSEGSIFLYSISEGNVISTLNNGDSYPISCLTWVRGIGLFASFDKCVSLWNISKKKVKCKWKCGDDKIHSLAVSEDGEFIVTGSFTLSLWRVKNEEISLIRTYTGHSSNVTSIKFVNNQYFLSCSSEDRHISAWSIKAEFEEPLGRFALGEVLNYNISLLENKGVTYLCAVTSDGVLHYFKHQLNGKIGKVIKPSESVEIVAEGDRSSVIPIVSAKLSSDTSAHIAYGHPPFLSFEPIAFNGNDKKRTSLVRSIRNSSKTHANNKYSNSNDTEAEYVGSGVRKKNKGGEVSMEDRLGNLSLGKPVVADKHSPHNLSNLLIQGLESRDKGLLDSVLLRADPAVISETVSKLPVTALPLLISQLSHMMQGKTFSSIRGCMWLKGVMRQHSSQILASSSTSSLLSSIQSLIENRLTVLGPLRSLSGRLEHIVSQFDSHKNETFNNDLPVVIYHDEDSGDDGESLVIDGEPSESEDVWDEGTDDPLDTETS